MEIVIPTVDEAPTVPLWPTGALAVGVSKATAYDKLAPSGQLCDGVPIIRVGGKWRVPTAPLRRVLGLDGGSTSAMVPMTIRPAAVNLADAGGDYQNRPSAFLDQPRRPVAVTVRHPSDRHHQ